MSWRQTRKIELGYEGEQRQRGIELAMALKAPEVGLDLVAAVDRAARRGQRQQGGRHCQLVGGWPCLSAATARVNAAATSCSAAAWSISWTRRRPSNAQVLFERDDHIPPAAVDKVRTAMHGKSAEVHV